MLQGGPPLRQKEKGCCPLAVDGFAGSERFSCLDRGFLLVLSHGHRIALVEEVNAFELLTVVTRQLNRSLFSSRCYRSIHRRRSPVISLVSI
ncbi:unnamed protein product [Victoria cruziana]